MAWLSDAWDKVTDWGVQAVGGAVGLSQDQMYGATTWLQGQGGQQILQWGAGAVSKFVGGGSSGIPAGAQALMNQQIRVQSQLQAMLPQLRDFSARRRIPLNIVVEVVRRALLAQSARPADREGVLRSGMAPGWSTTPTSLAGNARDEVQRLMGLSTGPTAEQLLLERMQRMQAYPGRY